jgi:hypothetical protein
MCTGRPNSVPDRFEIECRLPVFRPSISIDLECYARPCSTARTASTSPSRRDRAPSGTRPSSPWSGPTRGALNKRLLEAFLQAFLEAFLRVNRASMALLYGRAGRLATEKRRVLAQAGWRLAPRALRVVTITRNEGPNKSVYCIRRKVATPVQHTGPVSFYAVPTCPRSRRVISSSSLL